MATLKERSWLDIPEPKVIGHVNYEDLSEEEKKEWDKSILEADELIDKFVKAQRERLKKAKEEKNKDN